MDALEWTRQCPLYYKCSVNRCPLDLLMAQRLSVPGDPERTCKLHLNERLKLAKDAESKGYKLLYGGLTDQEILSGKNTKDLLKEWDQKADRKKAQVQKMRKNE